MRRTSGFTLVEVLVALLLGAVGLLGTLAVQQAVLGASKAANDSAVALRLASQKLEEFSTALTTGNPSNATPPNTDQLKPLATAAWVPADANPPTYLNAEGIALAAGTVNPPPQYRWGRRWRIIDQGPSQPYAISVTVTYKSGTGDPKSVRLDMERRKSW
jgi:prepilin-type N-terminal cleavage/methylation domain-containing protein